MKVMQKKVCVLGDFAVGKTSLIRQFVYQRFSEKYLSTIGVQLSRKTLKRPNLILHLILWDLAGGDNHRATRSSYLRGVTGAIIVCDLTRHNTLPFLEAYTNQVREVNPKAPIIFVGNKLDLTEERVISDAELAQFSKKLAIPYRLTSAKTGTQIEEVFKLMADFLSK